MTTISSKMSFLLTVFVFSFLSSSYSQENLFLIEGIWNNDGSTKSSTQLLTTIDSFAEQSISGVKTLENIRIIYDEDCILDSIYYEGKLPGGTMLLPVNIHYNFSDTSVFITKDFGMGGYPHSYLSKKTYDHKNRFIEESYDSHTTNRLRYINYDSLDRVTFKRFSQKFNGNLEESKTDIQESFRYDSLGRLLSSSFSESQVDNVLGSSSYSSHTEYSYISDLLSEEITTVNSKLFEKTSSMINQSGSNKIETFYNWNSSDSLWIESEKVITSWDERGNNIYSHNFKFSDHDWILESIQEYEYDENNNELLFSNYSVCDSLIYRTRKISSFFTNNTSVGYKKETRNCNSDFWYTFEYFFFEDEFNSLGNLTTRKFDYLGNDYSTNRYEGNLNYTKSHCQTTTTLESNSKYVVSIYPNPSSSKFTLKIEDYHANLVNFQLYDLVGKLLFTNIIDERKDYTFGGELHSGHYILVLNDQNGYYTSKKILKTSN